MSSLGIQRRGIAGVYYLPAARDLEAAIGDEDPPALMNAGGESDGNDRAAAIRT